VERVDPRRAPKIRLMLPPGKDAIVAQRFGR
jgi:hypothetical protein